MKRVFRLFLYAVIATGAFFLFKRFHFFKAEAPKHIEIVEEVNTVDVRHVEPFHTLNMGGNYELTLEHGPDYKVRIEAPSDYISNVRTNVDDQELKVRFPSGVYVHNGKIKVTAYSPKFNRIQLGGNGKVNSVGSIVGSKLEISVSGNSDLKLHLSVDHVDVQVSGNSHIELKGATQTAYYKISGAGHVEAEGLNTGFAQTIVSGSGNLDLNVREELNVNVSGAGHVSYKGDPQLNKNISGIGKVTRR